MSRRLLLALLCCAALAAALPAGAQAAFGLEGFDVSFAEAGGTEAAEAGSHPDSMTTTAHIRYSGTGPTAQPDGEIKDLTVQQIAGLVADPGASGRCSTADFLAYGEGTGNRCPDDSAVGVANLNIIEPSSFFERAVYNLTPPPGVILRLGITVERVPLIIDAGLNTSPPYNGLAALRDTRQTVKAFGAEITLWGVPADPSHDALRGGCAEGLRPSCPSSQAGSPKPFLTLPTSCTGPAESSYEALSWRGERDSGSALTHDAAGNPQGFTHCEGLGFDHPTLSSEPTSRDADSASGLDFNLGFAQQGLLSPSAKAPSALKAIRVTLPPGLTADPSIAEGLGTCTEADLARETLSSAPGQGCPSSSKIGTVGVKTPLLEDPIEGDVYIATPDDPSTAAPENPFDSLLAFYVVLRNTRYGVLVKLPAKVEPDPRTGQLVTTMEDLPQLPFSSASFHFREGQRAPLITPPTCGAYATDVLLTPWSDPGSPVSMSDSFQITHGPGGGECPPGGEAPFDPGFQAGSENNAAKTYSPFVMQITRKDGERDLTRFAATLPPGVSGRLAGIDRCPEAQIALAKTKSARAELASPSCPANSKIGRTLAGAGVGGALTYVPGSLYLSGPYNGDPLSVVAITPAMAGPFDAGTVVVREALTVDPVSAEVKVDPAASDQIPHILKGIPLRLRELQVFADRPDFTLNPTSCDPSATRATLWGSYLDPFGATSPEASIERSDRYQAADCARLPFGPRLALHLKGGTRRGAHPALRAVYRPRPQDANLRRLALLFPNSEFVENAHFRTICTRVQFAAGAGHGASCPKNSVYGHITAYTPLLSEPLKGPVFLRSSNHNLPDAVFALHGLIDIEVAVRIDSVHGRLRATVQKAPDQLVSRVVVNMQGAKKGLFVNSKSTCAAPRRARAAFAAQNAKRATLRPALVNPRCHKHQRKRHPRHRRR